MPRPFDAALAGLRAVHDQPFRRLWLAQAASAGGESLVQLALPFAVLGATKSPVALGLVLTAYGAARVVALPVGGAVADRFSRRTVLVAAESAKALAHVSMALALVAAVQPMVFLSVGTVLYGLAYGVGLPALTGVVPQLVDRQLLREANALLSLSRSIAQVAGFAGAGVIVAMLSPEAALGLGAVLFAASALAVSAIGALRVAYTGSRSLVRDFVEGWSGLTERRWYWLNLVTHSLWNIAYAAFFVLGPVIAERNGGGAAGWSAVSVAVAVGGFIGGFVALYLRADRPLLTGNLAMALVVLPFVALAMGAPLAVVAIATALGFAGPTLLNVLWAAALQENVPEALLSRLSSYDWTISLAVLPLGSAAAGWSIDAWGVIPTLIWAAVFTLVPAVAALLDDEQRTFRRGGMASTSVPVSTTGRLAPAGTEDGR